MHMQCSLQWSAWNPGLCAMDCNSPACVDLGATIWPEALPCLPPMFWQWFAHQTLRICGLTWTEHPRLASSLAWPSLFDPIAQDLLIFFTFSTMAAVSFDILASCVFLSRPSLSPVACFILQKWRALRCFQSNVCELDDDTSLLCVSSFLIWSLIVMLLELWQQQTEQRSWVEVHWAWNGSPHRQK